MNWIIFALTSVLATWQIVELWFHGSVTLAKREQLTRKLEQGSYTWKKPIEMLLCPFCLTPWVGWAVAAWLLVAAALPSPWVHILAWPLYGLAISRAANLGHDLTRHWCLSPQNPVEEDSEELDLDETVVVADDARGPDYDEQWLGYTNDEDPQRRFSFT